MRQRDSQRPGADTMEALGNSTPAAAQRYGSLLKRAQRNVERRHLRDRFALLYHEKERKKMRREMGQDPYLGYAGLGNVD